MNIRAADSHVSLFSVREGDPDTPQNWVGPEAVGDPLTQYFDISMCERCGGRRTVIALVQDAWQERAILLHLGLDTETYEPLGARGPPQVALAW